MHRKNKLKAIVAIAVAMAFITPVAAFVNVGTIGLTNIEDTNDMENIVEISTNSDTNDNIETAIDDEKPFIEPVEDPFIDTESIVNDDSSAVLSTGNTTYVDDNADPSWYDARHVKTIKEGITNSTAGDNVYIHNGTYYENNIQVNKQLNIMGESRTNTIIDGGSSSSPGYGATIDITTVEGVNISTLTVKRSYKYTGVKSIYVQKASNIIIKDCDIDNTLGEGYGIYVHGVYPPGTYSGVDIINCDVYNTYRAIVTEMLWDINIIDCTTHDNALGISLGSGDIFSVKNCMSYNNSESSGIYIVDMKHGDVTGCNAYNNKYGIWIANSDYVDIVNCSTYGNTEEGIKMGSGINHPENCNIIDCTSNNNQYGIYLYAIKCTLVGNTMYDNGCNLLIEGDPYQYIIDPTSTVNAKPVYWLIGAENITLDGSINFGYLGLIGCNNITAEDASPEGIVLAYTTKTTLSNITRSGTDYGFYLYGGSNIKIEKCTASNNTEAAFYISNVAYVTMIDCHAPDFKGYSDQAIYFIGSPYATLINCSAYNVGRNKGFHIYSSHHATLINCHAYNGGPTFATGIYLSSSPYSTLTNCTVHDFQYGIDLRSNSYFVTVTNCTVYNVTKLGFEARSSDCTFINCTLYNSEGFYIYQARNILTNVKSYNNSYGVYLTGATDNTLVNCEFYNNSKNGIDIRSSSYRNTFTNCKSYANLGYGANIIGNSYPTVFADCQVYNNTYGIYFTNTPNNVLTDTSIFSNTYNFDVIGAAITDFYQDIDTSNTIDGKTIYYLVDKANMTLDETSNVGYLRIITSNNITVKNIDLSNLMVIRTTNSTLSNIISHDGSKDGIYLWESSNNDIVGCTIYSNTGHGIYLYGSSNNNIASCTVYNNTGHGIYLLNSPDNDITGCNIYGNNYGIYISASSNSILRDNILSGNAVDFGITGVAVTDYYQYIDVSNRINGDPMYYLIDDSGKTIDETDTFGYLILVSCDKMTLRNLDIADLLIIRTTNSTLSNIESHGGKDGIYLWESSNNDIVGCTIYSNTGYGIYLRGSPNNNLTDCKVYSNKDGIYLSGSSHNLIDRCNAYNNGNGFYLTGSSYNDFIQCKAYSNTNGFYLTGSTWNNIMISDIYGNSNYGIYLLVSSNNNNIILCSLYGNKYGFYLDKSSYCNIEKCDIYDNSQYGIYGNYFTDSSIKECNIYNDGSYGIYLKDSSATSSKCVIERCNIYGNSYGIYGYYLSYSVIEKCDISGNSQYGIYGKYFTDNNIRECKIHGSSYGIYFDSSSTRNTVVNCTIYNNANGIYHYKTSSIKDNKAYHNTIASNTLNAYSYYSNIWDNGYPSGGNYWSDYTGKDEYSGPNQNEPGSDGIGDTPYNIPGGTYKDRYPLMDINDTILPEIADVVLITSDPIDTEPGFGWEKVTCTVTDNLAVGTVRLVVTNPDMTIVEYPMIKIYDGTDTYKCTITLTQHGYHSYHIWAADLVPNTNTTDPDELFALPPNWDVDMNGQTYFSDLMSIVWKYGNTGPKGWIREDIDNSGQVYFSDLMNVVWHYTEWWK